MNSPNNVRRVDDLGRIVIPKQIRKILKIEESDSLEFTVDTESEEITLKKCSEE